MLAKNAPSHPASGAFRLHNDRSLLVVLRDTGERCNGLPVLMPREDAGEVYFGCSPVGYLRLTSCFPTS